ncbi:MAG: hypothetical protein Rpha_1083 [Candidatus Ruthia sp. Apha_13_S6]|nr:hypothetical protein [Candidatus Ruthia sp. Apha_13_S6]
MLPLPLYCACFLAIKSVQVSSENLLDATAVNGSGVLLPSAIHSYYAEKLAQKNSLFFLPRLDAKSKKRCLL